jgi:hypothetical protein
MLSPYNVELAKWYWPPEEASSLKQWPNLRPCGVRPHYIYHYSSAMFMDGFARCQEQAKIFATY